MTDLVLQALREIVPVTRGRLNLGGRMLRWVESGTGAPAVILIAGRNDTALSWGPVLAALAGRTRAVAYDRAGLGDSDPDPKILSAERTVADLSRLINVVSAGRCVVAGHSYGATHIIAEGSGHAVPLDRPVLVAETILGLTRALPPQ